MVDVMLTMSAQYVAGMLNKRSKWAQLEKELEIKLPIAILLYVNCNTVQVTNHLGENYCRTG